MRRGDPRLPVAEQISSEGLLPWMKRLLIRLNDRFREVDIDQVELTDYGQTDLHRHEAQYGEMYADNVSQAVAIAAGNTWTNITAGMSAGDSNAFTFQNNSELLCNVAGKYAAQWSLAMDTTGANDDIEGGIGVNGVVQIKTKNHTFVQIPNEEFGLASGGTLTLVVGDVVTLMVNNNTDADDLVLEHANLMLWKLGD